MLSRHFAPLCALLAIIALPLAAPSASARGYAQGAACGLERWSVKTLGDSQAGSLPRTPRFTSLAYLTSQEVPFSPDDRPASRFAPMETTLWQVRARLVGYRIEEDSDFHLLLKDDSGHEMIAEIPAPYCASNNGAMFAAAREAVERIGHHRASSRWWWLDYRGATPPMVLVTGYGFRDREHGQVGAAENNVELHPVTRIQPL